MKCSLLIYLLSAAFIQAAPLISHCPCRNPPKPQGESLYNEFYFGCGCGGGGGGGNSDEIPPDQD